jgi:hypothetical protein
MYFIVYLYFVGVLQDTVTLRKMHGEEIFKIKHVSIRSCKLRHIKWHEKFTIACKPSIIHNGVSVYINNSPFKQSAIKKLQMYYSNEFIFSPLCDLCREQPQFYNHMTSNIFSV